MTTPRGGRRGQLDSSGLRPGWTTGACATAAARAAYRALRTGDFPDPVVVDLPGGRRPAFALTYTACGDGWATAAVTKDSGDDPDVTHGAVVQVRVSATAPGSGVTFAAGPGVGTVTLPGLPLDVGEPAINPMPRQMILDNLLAESVPPAATQETYDEDITPPDVQVQVGIVDGDEIATHTLNSRLGIVGGLSVLGTTGVVVPYSCSAWIDSIRRGVDVARAAGMDHIAACTGSTSERVVRELYDLPDLALVDMGDFAGAVLTYLRRHPVSRLTLCGGFAKLSKLAVGYLDLHSGRSRVDLGFLSRLVSGAGGSPDVVADVANATTALGALQVAAAARIPLGDLVAAAARDHACTVLGPAAASIHVDVICVDRSGAVVGRSDATPPPHG
ncbi:Cobalt-precorrin-5B C(1)-methyltransferase [Austwickia sp. TVS 96-490-7B]|uniref:cobalt-precorrin-5B (C(1))-methyltransferase n=1 Tax=Austwickia sp. TVS 96-490-7B TaxID=2830843 RepID=UPI001C58F6CC|nr:cobalt-precorrin-5B (C(1))-methyltransferase [Austwickia sp. TVS 96-490-7B]MBW3084950.1 Cobalt-precorrin-5B C(1)-methyltransferase [Austwickia sp. TVS 96-490-7B]